MIQFKAMIIHKCSFCGRETESYTDTTYYTIDIYRKCADAVTKSSTERHIVEKTMCGECYNKLSLYLVDELTNREGE